MKARRVVRAGAAWVLLILALWGGAEAQAPGTPPPEDPEEAREPALNVEALQEPPPIRSPVFQAATLPPQPAAGTGRLNLAVGGNRQWCTYRDDRVVQPPPNVELSKGQARAVNPVFTFGYQFTIAAVARSRPAETLLLFESPVIRTAVLRQAAKLGRGAKEPPGPTIVVPAEGGLAKRPKPVEQPGALVPMWQEQYACTTLPPSFDFDLAPGAYDVYMAFDILGRSGAWAHRSVGFLTDVVVEEGRQTRLEGMVDMIGGGRRQVELLSSSLLPGAEAGAGTVP
jgi:hypothetical protein